MKGDLIPFVVVVGWVAFISPFMIILLGLIASEVEARNDQWGESKKDKIRDGVFLTIFASAVSYLAWRFVEINPLKTVAVLLAVRIAYFDYRVSYLLIKNKVIVGHWFTYSGKTAKWDKVISKVNPWVRLAVRIVFFACCLLFFLIDRSS